MRRWLVCRRCGSELDLGPYFAGCPRCGGTLEVTYDYAALDSTTVAALVARSSPARCAELLPVADLDDIVTLGEGNTPLVPGVQLGAALELEHCYLKNETVNPTWGHKDRAQSIMLTKARDFGYDRIAVASTGNHGASAAAYATRSRCRACAVFCPPETSDLLLRLIEIFGGSAFVADWEIRHQFVRYLVSERSWFPATGMWAGPASNPYGVEGYKSLACEIVRDLGRAPDQVYMACAVGESLYGVYKGFKELVHFGVIDRVPKMMACQPSGANVLEQSTAAGLRECITLPNPSSIATSVREPSSGEHALEAIYESGGRALSVGDDQIVDMMRLLGREGLCVEPASAVAAAGLAHGRRAGWISDDEWVVAVLTSSGIKWPQQLTMVTHGAATLEPTLSSLQAALSARGLDSTSAP
jgi:threonine synthase